MSNVIIVTAAITAFVVGLPLVLYALRLRVERNAARDLLQREVDAVAEGVAACARVIPPANEADKPAPLHVLNQFAAIRAEICGGKKLFWQAPPKAVEKAVAWLQAMPPDAVADIEPAIRMACQKAKRGAKGWTDEGMTDPNFLFGALVARWSGLREELHQCRPPPPGSLAARPPAKPVVPEWKPKGDYAAEAAADRPRSCGGTRDGPSEDDVETPKQDLAEHVTPPTAA